MKQYKITVAYDGTQYSGWLKQPDKPSIEYALEKSFFTVFKKQISLLGASKTDAGVHALGQVAIFKTDLLVEIAKMQWAWNKSLPESITILSIVHDEQFHPHRNVVNKTYWYHVSPHKLLPFYARYGWYYRLPFDENILEQALQTFVGTHDFRNFYKGDDRTDTVRTIEKITMQFMPEYGAYRIEVIGNKFLRHMIRRMVGTALHVAAGKATIEDINNALTSRHMNHALPTAPAKGLLLQSIYYAESTSKN